MTDPAAIARRNSAVEANLPLVLYHLRGRLWRRRGWVDGDDLIQEGALGLIRAITKHDPDRSKLAYYAGTWIRDRAAKAASAALGPMRRPWRHRNDPIAPKAPGGSLEALPARDDRSDHLDRLDALWDAIEAMREPDRTVIQLRYGEGLLLREVGERLGRTTERVRQIEARGGAAAAGNARGGGMIGTKATTHRIEIPGWIPYSTNRLIRAHWGKATRHKRAAYAAIDAMAFRAGVPQAQGRRRVSVTVTVNGRGRLPDGDNMLKCLLDGLVKCGALRDDGPAWCELGTIRVERGPQRGTTITLEDIPDAE